MVGHHWSVFDHGQAISNCDIAWPWSNMVNPLKKQTNKQTKNKQTNKHNKNKKMTILIITIAKNEYYVTVLYKVRFWTNMGL